MTSYAHKTCKHLPIERTWAVGIVQLSHYSVRGGGQKSVKIWVQDFGPHHEFSGD